MLLLLSMEPHTAVVHSQKRAGTALALPICPDQPGTAVTEGGGVEKTSAPLNLPGSVPVPASKPESLKNVEY